MKPILLALLGCAAPLAALSQTGEPTPASALSVRAWMDILVLGAMAGALGQMVRAASGFAKLRAEGQSFQASKLVVSLVIGATAGALAAVPLLSGQPDPGIPTILGLMGAGYAGADFIEGFAGKYLPGAGSGQGGTEAIDLARMREEVRQLAAQSAQVSAQLQALPAPKGEQAVG